MTLHLSSNLCNKLAHRIPFNILTFLRINLQFNQNSSIVCSSYLLVLLHSLENLSFLNDKVNPRVQKQKIYNMTCNGLVYRYLNHFNRVYYRILFGIKKRHLIISHLFFLHIFNKLYGFYFLFYVCTYLGFTSSLL